MQRIEYNLGFGVSQGREVRLGLGAQPYIIIKTRPDLEVQDHNVKFGTLRGSVYLFKESVIA